MGPGWVALWGPRGDPVQLCPQGRRGGRSLLGLLHPIPEGARLRLSLPAVPSPSAVWQSRRQPSDTSRMESGGQGPS